MRLVVLNGVAHAAALLDAARIPRDVAVFVALNLVRAAVHTVLIGAFVVHRQPQLLKLCVLDAADLRILWQRQRCELLFT